jgi:hypothetical protein
MRRRQGGLFYAQVHLTFRNTQHVLLADSLDVAKTSQASLWICISVNYDCKKWFMQYGVCLHYLFTFLTEELPTHSSPQYNQYHKAEQLKL